MKSLQIQYLVVLLIIGIGCKALLYFLPDNHSYIEILILFAGLLFTGIPHGAIDHFVAKRYSQNSHSPFHFVQFLLKYILLILAYAFFWWWLPGLSLCLFIFLTALHFGETDLHHFGKENKMQAFAYGIFLTSWLLLTHPEDLMHWIEFIIPKNDPVFIFTYYLFKIPSILFLILALAFSFPKKEKRLDWLLFSLILILVNQLGLIGGFAFYFAGWHGWLAFNDIRDYIKTDQNLGDLWKKAIPFTLLASFTLIIVNIIMVSSAWKVFGAPAIIVMISLLTLPHMEVMRHIYTDKA